MTVRVAILYVLAFFVGVVTAIVMHWLLGTVGIILAPVVSFCGMLAFAYITRDWWLDDGTRNNR